MRGVVELLSLLRRQWWTPSAIEDLQVRRLRRLVRHAAQTVPFYGRLFADAGVDPAAIQSLGDLQQLPIVTRTMLQEQPAEDLIARGTDRHQCCASRTSGSTGTPLEIVCRRSERALYSPSFFRAYLAWGLRPHHRLMYMQARRSALTGRSWYEKLGVFRRETLFSGDDPRSWIDSIRRWRPQMLHGYALTLKLLADAVHTDATSPLRVPLVVSTSGILDEAGRRSLASALNAEVVDLYASEEAGSVIAWQCPVCPGYHLCVDAVVVELLHDGRPAVHGEDSQVVVTNLNNFTMPFVRYDQGDIVRLTSQRPHCGRGLPLIESVRGRAGDYILLPSGRRLTPHPFFLVLDHAVGVGQWQLVQEERDRIIVRVAPQRSDQAIDLEGIRSGVRGVCGEDVQLDVLVVKSVRRDAATKLRSVVSRLPEAHGGG